MTNYVTPPPCPVNEPVREYRPGSDEANSLKLAIEAYHQQQTDVPLIINGERIFTQHKVTYCSPHDHEFQLGQYSCAKATHVEEAISVAEKAHSSWSTLPWQARAAVFLKAAELAAGPWRDRLNAATVVGQSKTVHQAEIDSACELIDFFRFNVNFMESIYGQQPISSEGVWNRLEYRPLEGFVFAVTPFNFTAIAANLPVAPALMGNTVIWKPSERAILSAYIVMELLMEAGLPSGVINFLPTDKAEEVGDPVFSNRSLAGIHFTGSTRTFQMMWKKVANNIETYDSYPRLVGETGGKDYVFAHPSADVDELVVALVRGAFEYQGQKCSAASRAYVPESLWDETVAGLIAKTQELKMGSAENFENFMGAVIDRRAYTEISDFIEFARGDSEHKILVGGGCDDHQGFFIEPTVIQSQNPSSKLMTEEIFGPALTIYMYKDDEVSDAIHACNTATRYALTGAIFAKDRHIIEALTNELRYSAGNFYINDKPTGAVVGQQPFGGGRASGTNDKAGSELNLLRWVNPQTIKETFVPSKSIEYPHMG